MLGPGLTFDTSKYLVVCANVLGSCYGSTGPTTINSDTNTKYGNDFPAVTIRDTVNAHMMMIKNAIGAKGIECVIGGSMGGMQALEWAIMGIITIFIITIIIITIIIIIIIITIIIIIIIIIKVVISLRRPLSSDVVLLILPGK